MQGFIAQMPFVKGTEWVLLKSGSRENNLRKRGQVVAIVEVPLSDVYLYLKDLNTFSSMVSDEVKVLTYKKYRGIISEMYFKYQK